MDVFEYPSSPPANNVDNLKISPQSFFLFVFFVNVIFSASFVRQLRFDADLYQNDVPTSASQSKPSLRLDDTVFAVI